MTALRCKVVPERETRQGKTVRNGAGIRFEYSSDRVREGRPGRVDRAPRCLHRGHAVAGIGGPAASDARAVRHA